MLRRNNQIQYDHRTSGKKEVVYSCALATRCALFLLLLVQFICVTSFSQKQRVKFEHLGTGAGLSQSSVMSIFQDSRGFMWFGTFDGLNKYDGYKFTVYKYLAGNGNSLSNNAIMNIAEDKEGNIWLATWGGGLDRFDWKREKFTCYRFAKNDSSSIGNDFINRLLVDQEGNLWIGTEGGGLNRYDKKNNNFVRYLHDKNDPQSLSDDWVKDIVEDAGHNLWIGTNSGGLNLFDKRTKKFRRFQHDSRNSKSLAGNSDWSLFIDRLDQLWIGTRGDGLDLFDREKESFSHFKTNPATSNSLPGNVIRAINEDAEGNIWVGTENFGLGMLNTRLGTFDNYIQDDIDNTSLNNNSISSIYRDDKGNMWTGTFSGGINFVSRDANKFAHYRRSSAPFSLSNNIVISIFEDSKENLWIGTDGGGLNLFDNKKGTFITYKHDPSNKNSLCGDHILEIFEDTGGDLWIGTWNDGITVFNKDKNTFRHFKYDPSNDKGIPSPNVWAISQDADKNIWIGTYGGGISQYDRKNGNFINYRSDKAIPSGISNNYVNFIYTDREGNLWIGTNGSGLDLFDKKTKTFSHFLQEEGKSGICNNNIYSLAEDKDGNLWIATGLGLSRMDRTTRQFTNYYIKDGLPSNTIMGLLFDKEGDLWMSTYNGLSRLSPVTMTFKNFDVNDGLQSDEFKMNSCYRSHSGEMYFGGINGFNGFFPDSIRKKKYEPPLVFTDFQVFNKQIPISEKGNNESLLKESITTTKELALSYDQSVISFEFASLNYVLPDKKRYAYMLENFDKNWNDVGTRHTATYTNLDPGKYVFKVRGLNNEGNWSSNIASIQLVITPPFWLTGWFRIAVLLLLAGSIFAFFRVRMKVVRRQQRLLELKVKEQTVQLVTFHQDEQKARIEAETAWKQADLANEKLEGKNKELEEFVYIASHDLREPLRTTASFVELFQEQYKGKLDETADNYLNYISQASDRMKTLINDLLDYSRIGGKIPMQQVDCNQVLQEVLTDLGVALQEAGAEIRADQLPIIHAHPTGIKQLFQNLIANGIKFSKKNIAPKIKISLEHRIGFWQFAFADNGIGIDEKHKERIFLIFQRLHTRSEYEGSGIGLAHCKKIVELHGGKIWIESVLGEGTTFYFTLPAGAAAINK